MRRLAGSLAALVLVSGCCGGYSVVRTTAVSRAEMTPSGELATGNNAVLHYSRTGEPPNTCGSGALYTENLWIQIPSFQTGQRHAIGAGAVAAYEREQNGEKLRATSVTGKITVKEQNAERVVAALDVAITLPSGQVVKIDDDYEFHTARPGAAWRAGPEDVRVACGR